MREVMDFGQIRLPVHILKVEDDAHLLGITRRFFDMADSGLHAGLFIAEMVTGMYDDPLRV